MIGTPSSNESAALCPIIAPRFLASSNGRKQPAGLSSDRIAKIYPDVGARIEGNEPSVRKAEVEGRRKL